MGTRLGTGQKSRAQHGCLRAQSQDGNHASAIINPAGRGDWPRGDCVHDSGDQSQGGDFPRHMAARLDTLRDNDVNSGGRRPLGVHDGPHLMEDLRAHGMGALHIRRRIAPEEREDRNPLFQTDGHMVLDGEVEDEIDTERPVGKLADAANDLTKEWRRAKLCLQDAEAARVAHRRDELRTGQVGPIGAAMIGCSIPSRWQSAVFMDIPRG